MGAVPETSTPAKRFPSLGTKLATTTVLVLLVVSGLLGTELLRRERDALFAAKQATAARVTELFAIYLAPPVDFQDRDALELQLAQLRAIPDVTYIGVWAASGTQPFGELALESKSSGVVPWESLPSAGRLDGAELLVARPLAGREANRIGHVVVRFSLAAESAAMASSRTRILLLCLTLGLGTAAVLVVFTRRQVQRPLARLLDATRGLEAGLREVRVQQLANDEVGRLGAAFNSMADAIHDRETRLEAANRSLRELFDHMRQGIVVFDAKGVIVGECSREAREIFGTRARAGEAIIGLFADEASRWDPTMKLLAEWVSSVFEEGVSGFEETSALAPKEIILGASGAGERLLTLEFRPIVEDGELRRVMLLATNVTLQRRLEREVETQRAAHAQQLAALRRQAAGGGAVFVSFLETSRARVARSEELWETASTGLTISDLEELFQHVHALKGEASAFELRSLRDGCHELEGVLAGLRSEPAQRRHVQAERLDARVRPLFAAARRALAEATELFVSASDVGRAVLQQVTVRRSDVDRLVELVGPRDGELGAVVSQLAARPFGECVTGLVERVPSWAESEGKAAFVEVTGREVSVPRELVSVLRGALVQLVRNAVAHGVEPPGMREKAGKPAAGAICVGCEADRAGPRISVEDDGGGIDVVAVLTKARAMGLISGQDGSPEHVAEALFHPGFSTRDDASVLAGRGVGLAAVRADLARLGYRVSVTWKTGERTRFVVECEPQASSPEQCS